TKSLRSFQVKNCERLKELAVADGSFRDFCECVIENLPSLEVLSIGNANSYRAIGCFQDSLLELRNLPSLKSVAIGGYSYRKASAVVFENLPVLTSISFGTRACMRCSDAVFENLPALSSVSFGNETFMKCKSSRFE
ncbi:hypothetical protein WA577_004993, partial [Blastocystis sp. JDR]